MSEDVPQRRYELREMFNALRWMARASASWRMLPPSLPRWVLVYRQAQRWVCSGCFEAMVSDLALVLFDRVRRVRKGRVAITKATPDALARGAERLPTVVIVTLREQWLLQPPLTQFRSNDYAGDHPQLFQCYSPKTHVGAFVLVPGKRKSAARISAVTAP